MAQTQKRLIDYQSEWSEDHKIDQTDLATESTNIPYLHSKYMNYLSSERLKMRKMSEKQRKLKSELLDYYQGNVDGKDIGRNPWPLTESKSSAEKRVDNDSEIIKMNLIMYELEEIVLFLKEVVVNINNRGFAIKNAIDWKKFTNGGY